MNTKLLLVAGLATGLALQFSSSAMADSISTMASASPNTLIPDNNLSGVASSMTVNSPITKMTSVTVTVDVVGAPAIDPNAWDGDFYCYLQYASDPVIVLLSKLGGGTYGTPANGFDITFDQTAANVSTAPGLNTTAPVNGTYAPQIGNLDSLNGQDPNGVWTLFIADESSGDIGILSSWSMDITGVPDNTGTLLLLSMGLGFLGLCSIRQQRLATVSRR